MFFCLEKEEREDLITDISQLYQIFPDEVLGSGQFGIVYGGMFGCRHFLWFRMNIIFSASYLIKELGVVVSEMREFCA